MLNHFMDVSSIKDTGQSTADVYRGEASRYPHLDGSALTVTGPMELVSSTDRIMLFITSSKNTYEYLLTRAGKFWSPRNEVVERLCMGRR